MFSFYDSQFETFEKVCFGDVSRAACEFAAFSSLKRYEDALDGLICAWVGMRYLAGEARNWWAEPTLPGYFCPALPAMQGHLPRSDRQPAPFLLDYWGESGYNRT